MLLSDFKQDVAMLQTLQRLVHQAAKHNKYGLPPHAYADDSAFHVIRESDYSALSVEGVQKLLCKKHLVITEHARGDLPFDEESLRSVRSLNAVVRIRGEHDPRRTAPNIPTSLSRSIQVWGKHHRRHAETGARMLEKSHW